MRKIAGGASWGIVRTFRLVSRTALPLALVLSVAAQAQDLQTPATPPPAVADVPATTSDQDVAFSADQLDYDSDADIVTATGDVRMLHQGNRLRAHKVVYNRKTGQVHAEGDVAMVNPGGDTAYADSAELTDTLRDGVAENILLVLSDGGRLAADHGKRVNGVTTLNHAAYSPCRVTDDSNCPKQPVWKVTATQVIHDPTKHRISYKDARVTLFGLPILWLPALSHPDGSQGGGSGLLVANARYGRTNGFELAVPYYWKLADNRDLTLTPHVFSGVAPALDGQYRQLTSTGAFEVGGWLTYGSRLPVNLIPTDPQQPQDRGFRGYFDANGTFQLGPDWTISGSARLTSDKTFLRRYDISDDDRLRSTINAERITADSYLSIAGWAVQSLRAEDNNGMQPIALPAIDYRLRFDDPLLGGKVQLQVNSLAILRTEGQDTQRAFAGLEWDLRRYTPLGQEITLTAYGRFDVYHTADVLDTSTVIYRGNPGWESRGIAAVAADMKWPFVGQFLSGTQVITPRVQVVASPPTKNLAVPNEDARAVDLEDSNLFALNRFPGYDRWEDGSRITYGAEWSFDLPRLAFRSIIGQSYRFSGNETIFPDGTGLSGRFSDIVGRMSVKYDDFVDVTYRFRLDKDSLQIRRAEADLTLGSRKTYLEAGYLRLNRDVDTSIEDLRDREELRIGGRIQFAKYWSIFGSTVIDLTDKSEDPLSLADGYEPIRHRLGILYSDDCLELGVTWRREYQTTGDVKKGNTFLLRLALKNLGR
jgi:LPS-assembly protein